MSWLNIAAINTTNNWQFTSEFSQEIIRLRHSITDEFPYGAKGLIAQSFQTENLELMNVKTIYPFYGNDIFYVENPFDLPQRLAIRGQTKYQTAIVWTVYLDVWNGATNLIKNRLESLENTINSHTLILLDIQSTLAQITNISSTSLSQIEQTFFFLN